MASKPGIFTDWPWKPLGSFKYLLLAPWVVESIYSFITKDAKERDLSNFLVLPFILWRLLHNQLWISLSRHRTAKGNNRIVDKAIEFDQVDREISWDDQIILYGMVIYYFSSNTPQGSHLPIWRTEGVVITILLHAGPVEFLYYWFHRALHHHFLYSRYHSHHHSSIVTEPITSVVHPFAEHLAYSALFISAILTCIFTHTASIVSVVGYITYIDFMNNMGHCNFELVPKRLFSIFPPLKYFMYTPSFHSLHHTQFRTNYCLFMPVYDYIYGTVDESCESLYEKSLTRAEEKPDVVHLTHLTTPESIYQLRLGFPYLASKPYSSTGYMCLLWPFTLWSSMMLTWICSSTFVVERNHFGKLRLQTWAIPKYKLQYNLKQQNKAINTLIEKAIMEAEAEGVKVLSLGLLNQGEELNSYGGVYLQKHPQLGVKLVDGSSLVVAVLLNSIPKGTSQVVLGGYLTKVAYALAFSLCQRDIKVNVCREDEFEKLKRSFGSKSASNLILSRSCLTSKIWLVGDGLEKEEQAKAEKGSIFIPFSQFPPKKLRSDCFYQTTPALAAPRSLENVDSCENWLPRRVLSAWRVAGMVHGLEGWEEHECGYNMLSIDKIWEATLRHGFRPLNISICS